MSHFDLYFIALHDYMCPFQPHLISLASMLEMLLETLPGSSL